MAADQRRPIPVPVLVPIYHAVKAMSHAERLEFATFLAGNPRVLSSWFNRSVKMFASYSNAEEAFAKTPPKLSPPSAMTSGLHLQQALANAPDDHWTIEGAYRSLVYVDYEVLPARTTQNAKHHLAVFKDGRRSTSAMRIDALLRADDGAPVVAELKAATAVRNDADPFYALIQALAATAQLATPPQRERLMKWYPAATFATEGPIDVLVVLCIPDEPANAAFWPRLRAVAIDVARGVVESTDLHPHVRRIDIAEARWNGELALALAQS
jgi:hypothetical protein